jgi:hypothetical protein
MAMCLERSRHGPPIMVGPLDACCVALDSSNTEVQSAWRSQVLSHQIFWHHQHSNSDLSNHKLELRWPCKGVTQGQLVQSKELTVSEADLIIILKCFLSFKTIIAAINIIVFRMKFSMSRTHQWATGPRENTCTKNIQSFHFSNSTIKAC